MAAAGAAYWGFNVCCMSRACMYSTQWQSRRPLAACADFARGGRQLAEVYDLLGMRVIVSAAAGRSPSAADKAAACLHVESVVASLWETIASRRKDYISAPKTNGYQSLHLAVRAGGDGAGGAGGDGAATLVAAVGGMATGAVDTLEVQIRSDEMDVAAESGASAHFAYKGGLSRGQGQRLQDWTGELMSVRVACALVQAAVLRMCRVGLCQVYLSIPASISVVSD